MPKKTLESLGTVIKTKRGDQSLREVAREIGIGPATLMRVENGYTPDISTFAKICQWLKIDPGEFLGFKQIPTSADPDRLVLSAHFKADHTPKLPTLQSLARMLQLAVEMQKNNQPVSDVEL